MRQCIDVGPSRESCGIPPTKITSLTMEDCMHNRTWRGHRAAHVIKLLVGPPKWRRDKDHDKQRRVSQALQAGCGKQQHQQVALHKYCISFVTHTCDRNMRLWAARGMQSFLHQAIAIVEAALIVLAHLSWTYNALHGRGLPAGPPNMRQQTPPRTPTTAAPAGSQV